MGGASRSAEGLPLPDPGGPLCARLQPGGGRLRPRGPLIEAAGTASRASPHPRSHPHVLQQGNGGPGTVTAPENTNPPTPRRESAPASGSPCTREPFRPAAAAAARSGETEKTDADWTAGTPSGRGAPTTARPAPEAGGRRALPSGRRSVRPAPPRPAPRLPAPDRPPSRGRRAPSSRDCVSGVRGRAGVPGGRTGFQPPRGSSAPPCRLGALAPLPTKSPNAANTHGGPTRTPATRGLAPAAHDAPLREQQAGLVAVRR